MSRRERWFDYLGQYLDHRYGTSIPRAGRGSLWSWAPVSFDDSDMAEASKFFEEGKTPEEFARWWGDEMELDVMNEEPFEYKPKHDGTVFDPNEPGDSLDQGSLFDQLG